MKFTIEKMVVREGFIDTLKLKLNFKGRRLEKSLKRVSGRKNQIQFHKKILSMMYYV